MEVRSMGSTGSIDRRYGVAAAAGVADLGATLRIKMGGTERVEKVRVQPSCLLSGMVCG